MNISTNLKIRVTPTRSSGVKSLKDSAVGTMVRQRKDVQETKHPTVDDARHWEKREVWQRRSLNANNVRVALKKDVRQR